VTDGTKPRTILPGREGGWFEERLLLLCRQYFREGDKDLQRSPLAKKLLKVPGIVGVFLGKDFITITKSSDIIWQVRSCPERWLADVNMIRTGCVSSSHCLLRGSSRR
jgi:hypothetical protein